jgi:peptidoglycan/LPS O-acetylase OafA/YrhL
MYGAILAFGLTREPIREWLRNHLTLIVLVAAIAVLAAAFVLLSGIPARRTIIAIGMPLPIAYTMLRPEEFVGRFLEWSPLQWIGKLSYSLYVWQMLFLNNQSRTLPIVQDFPFAFLGALLCAVACHYLIETPAIKAGRRFSGNVKTNVA